MAKKEENSALEEGRRLQAAAVAAQEARDQQAPTPTQDEVDRAKLGEAVELEPSGTPEHEAQIEALGEQAAEIARKAEAAGNTSKYKTRAATSE